MNTKILTVILCIVLCFTTGSIFVTAADESPNSDNAAATSASTNKDPITGDSFDASPTSGDGEPTSTTVKPTSTSKKTTSTTVARPVSVGSCGTLKYKFVSLKSARLSWTAAKNAQSYIIYRNDGSSVLKEYKTVTTSFFVDTGLKKGKTYTYQIVAVAKSGTRTYYGAYSNAVKVNTLPSKVARIKITSAKKALKVKISKTKGANGYQVVYSTSKKFKKSKTRNLTKTTVSLKKLKSGKKYYIKVRAYKVVNGKKLYNSFKTISAKTK